MTTRESDPMTIDHAVAQARELLAALDQQLAATTGVETDEARERVALLSFGLTALLEQLGAEPSNDVAPPAVSTRPLVQLHEAFSTGRDRRAIVAQFAARWFVLTGFTKAPLSTYGVLGPYDHASDARGDALRLHNEAAGIALWAMQKVVQA